MTPSRIVLAAGDATATLAPDAGGMLVSLRVAGRELLAPKQAGEGPVPRFGSYLLAPWVAELSLGQLEFRGLHARIPPNQGRHAVR